MQTLQEQLNKLEENLTSTRHSQGPLTQVRYYKTTQRLYCCINYGDQSDFFILKSS